jgi:hypothetical protein
MIQHMIGLFPFALHLHDGDHIDDLITQSGYTYHPLGMYRIKSCTTTRRTSTYRTHIRPWLAATTLARVTLPRGGELKPPSPFGEVGFTRFTV